MSVTVVKAIVIPMQIVLTIMAALAVVVKQCILEMDLNVLVSIFLIYKLVVRHNSLDLKTCGPRNHFYFRQFNQMLLSKRLINILTYNHLNPVVIFKFY